MQVDVSDDPSRAGAEHARRSLKKILQDRRLARILVATGSSQLRFLQLLTQQTDIDWARVELFHLDEYIGLGADHPASFARYIRERFIKPTGVSRFHLLDEMSDPDEMIQRIGAELTNAPVNLAFAGIGENGHLAFNDPPADFETQRPYITVELDDACRRQQVGEGWFASLDEVPKKAISISIHQFMQAQEIICVVPDLRKAQAVAACLDGDVSPEVPASILRLHPSASLYLDHDSASLLKSVSAQK